MTGGTKRQKDMRKALRALIPRVPMDEAEAILAAALAGHLRHLPVSTAVWLATTARVRHAHTDYNAMLADGFDPDAARFFVLEEMNEVLTGWGCARRIDGEVDGEA